MFFSDFYCIFSFYLICYICWAAWTGCFFHRQFCLSFPKNRRAVESVPPCFYPLKTIAAVSKAIGVHGRAATAATTAFVLRGIGPMSGGPGVLLLPERELQAVRSGVGRRIGAHCHRFELFLHRDITSQAEPVPASTQMPMAMVQCRAPALG